jgi:MYXO-CTERM domain-containing protein
MLLWISLSLASPYVEWVDEPVIPGSLLPGEYDALLEAAAGRAPADATHVEIRAVGTDGVTRALEDFMAPVAPVIDKEPARFNAPVDNPGNADGALSGKAVYLAQCHGFIWYDSVWGFTTQRPNLFDTVEDFHNPEGANQYLARYLENAGAAVFTTKERGMNRLSAIADNDGDGYSESGTGFSNGAAGFADHGPWVYGDDPFDAGSTRVFPAAGGGVATWVPQIPADGVYTIYVTWDSDAGHATDAHYRVTHPGGVIDRTFDQTVHGSTWQYIETLWLPAGTGGLTIELIADSAQATRTLNADAVRIGGGMGDVRRHDELSGRPRWEEGAIQYVQYNGGPTSVYDPYADGNGSDPSSRSRWAAWEHPSGEDAVYLSWHSNAGGGTGTSTYTYESGSTKGVEGSEELSALLQDEIVDAIRALWDPDWTSRGTKTAAFSEVNPSHNSEMPAALVELAFHDHEVDVELLKEPKFRRDASRAMYRAIVQYFADKDGTAVDFLPEPPIGLALLHDAAGELELSWSAGPSGFPYGDAASQYMVYTSVDGRSWDNGTVTNSERLALQVSKGQAIYARVAALNDGGLSFPSEVVGARRARDGTPVALVVAGFDRLQSSLLPWEAVGGAVGDVRRMELWRVNPFDVISGHGRALDAAGVPFDGIADERLSDVTLDDYDLVIWAAGEESTLDETLSTAQQATIEQFVANGGAFWISGAEVLWDLDAKGGTGDQAFCQAILGASLADDDSGTSTASGVGILAGLDLSFGERVGGAYPIEYPDVLATNREVVAIYEDGSTAGALGDGVFLLGFPFEVIGSEADRAEMAARLVDALVPGWTDQGSGDTETSDTQGDDTGDVSVASGPWERSRMPAGCGCASTSGGAPWALGWVLGLIGLRRRRS